MARGPRSGLLPSGSGVYALGPMNGRELNVTRNRKSRECHDFLCPEGTGYRNDDDT